MSQDDIDISAWAAGMAILTIGSGVQWGWPAALIVVGAVLAGWPLVKTAIRMKR